MVINSGTALVAANPISWASAWNKDREPRRSRHDLGWRNGIVYMGVEANRTKQIYSASGLPLDSLTKLGQLIDIYV